MLKEARRPWLGLRAVHPPNPPFARGGTRGCSAFRGLPAFVIGSLDCSRFFSYWFVFAVQSTGFPTVVSGRGAVPSLRRPRPLASEPGRGGAIRLLLSDNSVVGHTRINQVVKNGFRGTRFQSCHSRTVSYHDLDGIHTHPRDQRLAQAGRMLREGEWHSP